MTNLRINFRWLLGLSLWLLVAMSTTDVFAQSQTDGRIPEEGISSYIFSPYAITVLLVLALVGQIAYRQRIRPSNRKDRATYMPEASAATKKRYDRDELSKLLKASATSKSTGRTLEEAIRLSRVIQPDFAERVEVHAEKGATNAPKAASHEASYDDMAFLISSDTASEAEDHATMANGDESVTPVTDDVHAVQSEPQSIPVEGVDEKELVK